MARRAPAACLALALALLPAAPGHRTQQPEALLERPGERSAAKRAVVAPLLAAGAASAWVAPWRPQAPVAASSRLPTSLGAGVGRRWRGWEEDSDDEDEDPNRFFFFPPPVLSAATDGPMLLHWDAPPSPMPRHGSTSRGPIMAHYTAAPPEMDAAAPAGARKRAATTLVQVMADHMRLGMAGRRMVVLPKSWQRIFEPTSIVYDEESGRDFVGRARLASTPSFEVAFASWRRSDPATRRHCEISRALSPTGVVPRFLRSVESSATSFVLTESPGTRTVATLIEEGGRRRASDREPCVELQMALPLMVDLLSSVVAMEEMGVVSSDLVEGNLYLVDNDTHALVADLRRTLWANSTSVEGSLLRGADSLRGSAFRHAPEMPDGIPTHISNSVWQLGLVFARLLLGGGTPTSVAAARAGPGAAGFDDATTEGRKKIREFIRERFDIQEAPGFAKLGDEYTDVLHLVVGMLERDPQSRCSPRAALREAAAALERRGLEAPSPRRVRAFPLELSEDAQ